MSERVQDALRDVMDEYEELRDAKFDYSREMAIGALGIALQELQNTIADLEARAVRCEGERDAANYVQRYGTPFDPTGAKTGIEIQSLRSRVEVLEKTVREYDELLVEAMTIVANLHPERNLSFLGQQVVEEWRTRVQKARSPESLA